jgi:hypothetical protein
MATERPSFWQRNLKWLGVFLLALFCAVVALAFAASPRLAAAIYDAGRFHPMFIAIRLTLYALLLLNWSRIALAVNSKVSPDAIHATKRSLIVLIVIFECLTAFPYLFSRI